MNVKMMMVTLVTLGTVGIAQAQDAYYADESYSAEDSLLAQNEFTAPKVVVIAGTKKGKCTPEMPMLKPNTAYEIQLQATADKTFVMDSADLDIHLKASPGKTASKVITSAKGDFGFTCGDEALPEKKRTQGMFMVM